MIKTRLQRQLDIVAITTLAAIMTGCAGAPRPPGAGYETGTSPSLIRPDSMDVLDLTYAFDESTIYWPNSPTRFQLTRLHYGPGDAGYFYASNSFSSPEHGGTHFDAPIHFGEGKPTVEQVPVRQLMGPAVIIDVSRQAAAAPDYRLTVADIQSWEERHGKVPEGAIVLLRTGWGERYPDKKRFLGDDTPGKTMDLHFPSYGREAAELLVNERRIHMLGTDTASIDYGPTRDFIVHQEVCRAGAVAVENVANIEKVPETGAWLIALPMKIAGGSGAPVRIVAFVPRSQ